MKLSQKIAELRKSHNWSQEELAYRLGVTRQSVGKWESDAALPELDKVVQMADIFGVTTDYLLKGNTDGIAANEPMCNPSKRQAPRKLQPPRKQPHHARKTKPTKPSTKIPTKRQSPKACWA